MTDFRRERGIQKPQTLRRTGRRNGSPAFMGDDTARGLSQRFNLTGNRSKSARKTSLIFPHSVRLMAMLTDIGLGRTNLYRTSCMKRSIIAGRLQRRETLALLKPVGHGRKIGSLGVIYLSATIAFYRCG